MTARAKAPAISMSQQAEEIERELSERINRYQRGASKPRESVGKYQSDRLRAALTTIQFLQKHRDAFVAFAKLYEFEVK